MYLLSINWSAIGLQAAQLLLSLSILVILHEFGHYITARWFKCRVEKFYLFFDWKFSLFKKKIGETEYGIGWLPLGGYVKIAGMIDESMDKEQMKSEPQPWEFRTKPAWQRLIIMLGGIIVNVLLAIVIYSMILFTWGEKDIKADSLKYGISFNDPIFQELGFKNGDKIIAIDGAPVEAFTQIVKKLITVNKTVAIQRDGKDTVLNMPVDLIGKLIERKKKSKGNIITPRLPVFVMELPKESTSLSAVLRSGDQIISVDHENTLFKFEYDTIMQSKKKGQSVEIGVKRADSIFTVTTVLPQDGQIGFYSATPHQLDSMGIYKYISREYSFFESFPAGVRRTGEELNFYVSQFKKILSPKTGAYKGVGGFKAMGSVFSGEGWDWEHFWTITALFSIILAFMNLLPIPALDGGHVVFTLYEMITGRKPNEKFLEYAQIVGMIILFGLMIYANANDWFGWGK